MMQNDYLIQRMSSLPTLTDKKAEIEGKKMKPARFDRASGIASSLIRISKALQGDIRC